MASTDLVLALQNPYHQLYREMADHQREHDNRLLYNHREQPSNHGCTTCYREGRPQQSDPRSRFSWAVPDNQAIHTIAEHAPFGVVEIGAGWGYWAWLLRQIDVEVYAYDIEPDGNHWCKEGRPWTEVLKIGPEAASWHSKQALMLCWPPYNEPMAYDALCNYEGDTLIYIGESHFGCTADSRFFAAIGETSIPCPSCESASPSCQGDEDHWCDAWISDHCNDEVVEHQGWKEVMMHPIPQWMGLHDYLYIYRR